MLRPPLPQSNPRRGVILLVVISLLTLFTVVGLAFVYYARARADAARIFRETQVQSGVQRGNLPPDMLFADFLRQFLFDVPDDYRGASSALRGHSLARSM